MSARVDELVSQLTHEEKAALMAGVDNWHTVAVERLGIPAVKVTDGPLGARTSDEANPSATLPATCFPSGVNLAATWNPELIYRVGLAIGEEARARGCSVLLGPCVNIHRIPLGGRNFESYSEDPYLSSRIAVNFIRGVQEKGVGACVKHFALNNQEYQRMTISSEADERTMREIYLPAFEAAVKEASTWSVMCSYNRINGTYAADNHWLLTGVLKDEWGFAGPVISDWFAVHSTAPAAAAGLDLEMPGPPIYFGEKLAEAVRNGGVAETRLDDAVRRLLELFEKAGALDGPPEVSPDIADPYVHRDIAREAAEESIVLLKNEDGILPLDVNGIRSLAVIGPNAARASVIGGGSSQVNPYYAVSPLEGLQKQCGDAVQIEHQPGCPGNVKTFLLTEDIKPEASSGGSGLKGEYFNNNDLSGAPVMVRVDAGVNARWIGGDTPFEGRRDCDFSMRWTAVFTPRESGTYTFGLTTADRARLSINGAVVCSTWGEELAGEVFRVPETLGTIDMIAFETYELAVEYCQHPGRENPMRSLRIGCNPPVPANLAEQAAGAAARCDAAVVFAGLTYEHESEGFDRETMDLPPEQVELIQKVAEANPKTVVVLNNGGPVALRPWLQQVPAVLAAGFPGQECGNAVAGILFGDVNPSGKLPDTLPRCYEDNPAYNHYPGEDGKVAYAEGVFVGYRHHDANNVEPEFPFGHGLSYTTFGYSNIRVDRETVKRGETVTVNLDVTNTGRRAGRETVQLYIRDIESKLPRPVKELKGFRKLMLEPGETRSVTFTLDERALSYWDPDTGDWVAEPGEFEALAGSSSGDIRLKVAFRLEG